MAQARVAIGLPAGDSVKTFYMLDLIRLYRVMNKEHQSVEITNPLMAHGSLIPMQRQMIADAAIRMDASHILWLDSDMRFPPTILWDLLMRNVDIVGAGYPERREPFKPTAFRTWADMDLRVYTHESSTGLEKVAALGGGMILVKTHVYQQMERPWYMVGYNREKNNYLGEDMYFSFKAAQAGFDIMLDHDASKQIGHIGEIGLGAQHAIEFAIGNPDTVIYGPTETVVKPERMPAGRFDDQGLPLPEPETGALVGPNGQPVSSDVETPLVEVAGG